MAVRLFPNGEQSAALRATLAACNQAANAVSKLAWDRRAFRRIDLQKIAYAQAKTDHGLAAQAAIHAIRKVGDAYRTLDRNSRRSFRWQAAQPYDARMLTWQSRRRHRVDLDRDRPDEEWAVHRLPGPARSHRRAARWASPTWSTVTVCGFSTRASTSPRPGDGSRRDSSVSTWASYRSPPTPTGERLRCEQLNRHRRRIRLRAKLQAKRHRVRPPPAHQTIPAGVAARRERQPCHIGKALWPRLNAPLTRNRRRGTDGYPHQGPAP